MYDVAGLRAQAESFLGRKVVVAFINARIQITTMLIAAERKKTSSVNAGDALQGSDIT